MTITTKEIGEMLQRKIPEGNDEAIPYFFLVLAIFGEEDKIQRTAIAETTANEFLSDRNVGKWQKVIPDGLWPLRYFGKFKRQSSTQQVQEKMQDWEKRLNETVRKKLIEKIEQQWSQKGYKEKGVKIIITRACIYVPFDEPMEIDT